MDWIGFERAGRFFPAARILTEQDHHHTIIGRPRGEIWSARPRPTSDGTLLVVRNASASVAGGAGGGLRAGGGSTSAIAGGGGTGESVCCV
jgi:hypothetical protein